MATNLDPLIVLQLETVSVKDVLKGRLEQLHSVWANCLLVLFVPAFSQQPPTALAATRIAIAYILIGGWSHADLLVLHRYRGTQKLRCSSLPKPVPQSWPTLWCLCALCVHSNMHASSALGTPLSTPRSTGRPGHPSLNKSNSRLSSTSVEGGRTCSACCDWLMRTLVMPYQLSTLKNFEIKVPSKRCRVCEHRAS